MYFFIKKYNDVKKPYKWNNSMQLLYIIYQNFILYLLLVYIPKHVTCFLKLAQQEEELRLEEEKFYEAKREAARIAKLQKAKEKRAKTSAPSGSKSWLGENEKDWDV